MRQFWLVYSLLFLCFFSLLSKTFAHNNDVNEVYKPRIVGERVDVSYFGSFEQFLFRDWLPGKIFLNNEEVVECSQIKYNAYYDEILLRSDSLGMIKLEKMRIKGFVLFSGLDSLVFERVFLPEQSGKEKTGSFLEVLYKDSLKLYAFRKVEKGSREVLNRGTRFFEKTNYYSDVVYYLQLPQNQWFTFAKLKRNTLGDIFPEYKKEINNLLRSNNINIRNNEKELVEAIEILQPVLLHRGKI